MEQTILWVLIKYTLITNHLTAVAWFQQILMSFNSKIGSQSTITCLTKLKATACRPHLLHIQRCKIETRFWLALMRWLQKLEACSAQASFRLCNKIRPVKYRLTAGAKSTGTTISSTRRRVRAPILRATTRAKEKVRFPLRAWWKYRTCRIRSCGQTQQTPCLSISSLTRARAQG